MSEPSNPLPKDISALFAAQLARIHAKLYPKNAHSTGPRRPDLADQEEPSK